MHQIALMKDEIRRLSELVQSFLNYGKPIEIHPVADRRANRWSIACSRFPNRR